MLTHNSEVPLMPHHF